MASSTPRTNGEIAQDTAGEAYSQTQQAIETVVDLPVGTALTVKDRVDDLTRPWRNIETATEEVKHLRHRIDRELTKVERRGGIARRKATQRAQRTRGRLEREVSQRRRRVETTVQENRRKAEESLKSARTRIGV